MVRVFPLYNKHTYNLTLQALQQSISVNNTTKDFVSGIAKHMHCSAQSGIVKLQKLHICSRESVRADVPPVN